MSADEERANFQLFLLFKDEKIQKGITELQEILQKPEFETLHPVGEEVKGNKSPQNTC